MTKLLRSFQIPISRKQRRPVLLSSSNGLKIFAFGILITSGALGCSGRNIHKDLTADPRVMVRNWAITTRSSFQAGDRGTEFSNPVVVDNTLVFGNRGVGLVCVYPSLDQPKWVLPIPGGVVSELTVDHGSVYFGGSDGFLYSVNLDNGRVNWRYEIRNPVISKPTVDAGRVFVTSSDDTVYAFDAGTGKWLWHYRRHTSPTARLHAASSPWVEGNDLITGLSDGFVVDISVADGQLRWEKKIHQGVKFTDVDAHPVVESGVIYIPSYDGALYALKRQGGDIIWKFDAGGSKTVTVMGPNIYFPSSDGNIYALQKSNAKVLWKFELDKGTPTKLIVTDSNVVVGSSFQYLYVLDRETGKGIYRYDVGNGSGFYGSPAYDPTNRRVYILSQAGNLYAFTMRKPARKVFPHGQADPYIYLYENM